MNDTSTEQKQSQTQSDTQVQTPNVPSWISSYLDQQGNRVNNVGANANDYKPAAASPIQSTLFGAAPTTAETGSAGLNQSIMQAMGMGNLVAPTYSAAGYNPATMTGAQVGGVGTISGAQIDPADIQRLMNPEINSVVNTTLANYDKQAGAQGAALDATAGLNSGAFGSSGYALQRGEFDADTNMNRANTEATLRSGAYNDAAGLAQTDAQRTQEASVDNQQTQLQRALAQAGFDQATSGANQEAQNTGAAFNAAAGNTASQANQSAKLQTLSQQLQDILGLGSLSGSAVQQATGLGQTQQDQQTAHDQYYAQMQLAVMQALNGLPVAPLTGQTVTSNGTKTGTGSSNSFGFGTNLLPSGLKL